MRKDRILILGGTKEARDVAEELVSRGIEVVSSLAGRVKNPKLPVGEVRIGGFGGVEGLANFLAEEKIDAVIDATHPFAATISSNAAAAAESTGVPRVQVRRPGYGHQDGDVWHYVESLHEACHAVPRFGRRPFITTGRGGLAHFEGLDCDYCLVRCVDPPEAPLPKGAEILLARGPFDIESEVALMTHHDIDVMVTKDSGGSLTSGKLDAARALSVPVIMVRRPHPQPGDVVADVAGVLAWLNRT